MKRHGDHHRPAADPVGQAGHGEAADRRRNAERAHQPAHRFRREAADLGQIERHERPADRPDRRRAGWRGRSRSARCGTRRAPRASAPAASPLRPLAGVGIGGSRISAPDQRGADQPGHAGEEEGVAPAIRPCAKATSSTGATNEPSRFEPKFWATPWAMPRCSGATSVATIAWLIGMTPPSATPISSRAPSSSSEGLGDAGEERAEREGEGGEDQQQLAVAERVGQPAHAEGGERPGQRQGAGEQADLGVGEAEVRLDERHQEIERVAVEEDDAEIEAEQRRPAGPGRRSDGSSAVSAGGGGVLMRTAGSDRGRPSRPRRARRR